jgi:hypothetical protein
MQIGTSGIVGEVTCTRRYDGTMRHATRVNTIVLNTTKLISFVLRRKENQYIFIDTHH